MSADDTVVQDARAAAARLIERLHDRGAARRASDGGGVQNGDEDVVATVERLLDLGAAEQALALIAAGARLAPRLAAAAPIAAELARIHFGESAADVHRRVEEEAAHPVTRAALVAVRLRPHRRSALSAWERELLRELLS